MKAGDKYKLKDLTKPIVSTFNYTILGRNGDEVTIISILDERAIVECNKKRFTVNKVNLK